MVRAPLLDSAGKEGVVAVGCAYIPDGSTGLCPDNTRWGQVGKTQPEGS